MTVEEALRFAIPRIGVAEFCELSGKSKTDADKFLKGIRSLKPETMDDYLKPFNLKTKLIVEKVA